MGDSFSTVGGKLQYCGGYSVQWGDNFSMVSPGISLCKNLLGILVGVDVSHSWYFSDNFSFFRNSQNAFFLSLSWFFQELILVLRLSFSLCKNTSFLDFV